ncbi:zinc-finger of the MIZ type in Nse subunit-domain-containing protein [Aspergillus recurvatus]
MIATPGPSRGLSNPASSSRHRDRDRSAATAAATPSRSGTPPLPRYEPPIAPLTDTGRQALLSLLRSQNLRQLKTHIEHVETKLTDAVGEVNERLTDAKIRAKKRAEREREREMDRKASRSMTEAGDGDGCGNMDGEEAEEAARLRELEESVEAVTGRLDENMRRAIDSAVRVDGLGEVLEKLQGEAEASANANSQRQRQRRRRRAEVEDEDEEEGDLYEATPEPEVDREELSLRERLERAMAEDQAKWNEMTLTERYSKHNDYVGFYRIIHEAKNPGEDMAPLPHASTWFAHLEDPNASTRSSSDAARSRNTRQRPRNTSSASDSDDLAIERERVSLRCPLTLLPFRDPVTSTKCPHSFEREAITSMIDQSAMTVPAAASKSGRGGRRIRAVQCPVCSEVLTNNDLREDPVLLRRVRRVEARQRREQEEDEEAELGLSGRRKSRQGGILLGSDDDQGGGSASRAAMDIDQVRIKQERARSRGATEVEDHGQEEQATATESETRDPNEGDEDEEGEDSGSDEDSNYDDEMEE